MSDMFICVLFDKEVKVSCLNPPVGYIPAFLLMVIASLGFKPTRARKPPCNRGDLTWIKVPVKKKYVKFPKAPIARLRVGVGGCGSVVEVACTFST